MVPASVGHQCPECVGAGARTTRAPRTSFGGRLLPEGKSPVTYAILAINVVVFAAMLSGQDITNVQGSSLFRRLDVARFSIGDKHEYYRLVTAAFVHFGIFHIFLNMYALVVLGPQLERIFGSVRFAALYLVAAIGGNVAVYITDSGGAGASTAIFGLFAAFYVVGHRARIDTRPILTMIGINLAITFLISGISRAGHVGGLITGAVASAVLVYAPAGPRRTPIQAAGLVGVLGVLVVLTLTHHLPYVPSYVQIPEGA
jgi:membrane associated rhomboid family serine protease